MGALRHPFVADCRETFRRLPAHLDGEDGRFTRARVRRHLERCPGCARLLKRLIAGITALGTLARTGETSEVPSIAPAVIDELRRTPRPDGPPTRPGGDE